MISASDKAMELVKKFANHSMGNTPDNNRHSAINCAHLCVTEILNELTGCSMEGSILYNDGNISYWKKVREELSKLW